MRSLLSLTFSGLLLTACAPKDGDDTAATDTASDDTGSTDTEDTGDSEDTGDTGQTAETARVRVAHLSPDAPAVDIYVAGTTEPAVSGLAYGAMTDWLEVPAGTYAFEIRAAGADPASAPVFTTDSWALTDGASATVTAMGLLASANPDDQFRVQALVESWGVDVAGSVRVRAIHASPDAPTVDLDVGADGTVDVPGFSRFSDTGAEGVVLPAGVETRIGVWAGGQLVTTFTVPALPEGTEALVFAAGLLAQPARLNDGFSLYAATDAGPVGFVRQDPVVYVLHGSPDAPSVDVFAGDAELISDFGFGELSAPLQVPPGAYTLDLFGASAGMMRPAGAPSVSVDTPVLEAGERYLAVATGFLMDGGFTVLPVQEGWDTADASLAQVGVIHASPDAPAVDVGTVASGVLSPLISDLAFGESTDPAGLGLPAGTYPLGIAAAGSTSPLLELPLTVAAGQDVWAVAVGSLVGDGASFRVLAVDTSTSPWSVGTLWE